MTAIRAADFVNGVGVNVHLPYTDGAYANVNTVIADLNYIGVNHVRDWVLNDKPYPGDEGQLSYPIAAQAGIKFDMDVVSGSDIPHALQLIQAFNTTYPGSVTAIEGPNEVNNWPVSYDGQTGDAGAIAFQNALYATAKANPLLQNLPVYNMTSYPDLVGNADASNFHFYPSNGDQPYAGLAAGTAFQQSLMPGHNVVITEAGYKTTPSGGGVDDITQAKLTLNLLFDAEAAGVKTTYLYQLLDAYADPTGTDGEKHWGLFDINNQPKPLATALHNLTGLLSDGGANASSFAAPNVNYSVSGTTSLDHTLLLGKSSGALDFVLWSEPDIWNESSHTGISVPSHAVDLTLDTYYGTVSVYDPLAGSSPIATYHDAASVQLAVTDHPLIVEASDPNPYWFNPAGYAGANPDVKASGENPLQEYHDVGWKQGLDPSANFDTTLYLLHNPDVAAAGIDPLMHFLTYGQYEGRTAYPAVGKTIQADGFDPEYYLLANPDVAAAGMDPYQHYIKYGWKEGRNPNAYFDTKGYLANYPDVAAAKINPLDHYYHYGWKEGRDPSAQFDTHAYLAHYTDVAAAHVDPLTHFLQTGIYHGYSSFGDGAFWNPPG